MRLNTIERARYRWREILPQLGIDARFLVNKHGPCPLCGGKDRFRFDDKEGTGSYYCNQCGPGPGLLLVRKKNGWDHATACAAVDKIIGHTPAPTRMARDEPNDAAERALRLRRIERLLEEATDQRVVDAFLYKRRLVVTTPVLRGHPRCPYYDEDRKFVGKFPAVIAPILGADGSLVSAALLYGSAAPEPRKKFLPRVTTISGGAVRLFEPQGGRLGVAEGIATAMAARQIFSVSTWAVLCDTGMKAWSPPPGVQRVTIFADHDESHAGQAAAYCLAQRLTKGGIAADVQMPNVVGTDFADLLPETRAP